MAEQGILGTTGVCLYDKFYPGRQKNENWVNPYKLGDVEGVITHEGQPSIFSEDHRYYFTRIKEGESYVCKNKEIIIPSNYNDNQNHIKIIWVGTNDANQNGINKFNLDNYIKEVKCLIGTTKRFLILALTAKPRFVDSIDDINARLQLEFGVHFVNIRDYILEYGLEDAGVVGTADDNEKISQGYMPPSLMETNDNIHFNDSGYRIVGRQVYIRGKKLGYWN